MKFSAVAIAAALCAGASAHFNTTEVVDGTSVVYQKSTALVTIASCSVHPCPAATNGSRNSTSAPVAQGGASNLNVAAGSVLGAVAVAGAALFI